MRKEGSMPSEAEASTQQAGLTGLAGGSVPADENFIQLITADGTRVANPDYDRWVADVTDQELIAYYEDMVVIRRIDTEATALQRQGQLALWAPLLGQEAAQIGSARAARNLRNQLKRPFCRSIISNRQRHIGSQNSH